MVRGFFWAEGETEALADEECNSFQPETFAKPLERRRSCSPSAAECRNAEFRMQNAEICISLLRVQTRVLSHLKVQPAGQEQRGGQVAGQTHFK